MASKRTSACSRASAASCGRRASVEDLAEVGSRLRLRVEVFRRLPDVDRLAGQPFRLLVVPASREHPRPSLPPEHLRDRVLFGSELGGPRRPPLGVAEPAELVVRHRPVPPRSSRARTSARAHRVCGSSPLPPRRRLRDLRRETRSRWRSPRSPRAPPVAPPRSASSARSSARSAWASSLRPSIAHRDAPVRAQKVTALFVWKLLVLPGEQLGERVRAEEARVALEADERRSGLPDRRATGPARRPWRPDPSARACSRRRQVAR